MAEVAGYKNQVWVLAGTTPMTNATGAKCKGVDNSTYKALCDIMEITAFGDTYKRRIAGMLDTEISFSGNFYSGDTTGQAVLIPGNDIMVGVYPEGTGVAGKQVQMIVESVEHSSEIGGVTTFTATFQSNGVPEALPLRP